MPIPLYNTDIIPMTSRPTLTVMDDGDYFLIFDTSTGKISKILKTNIIIPALKISYDNTSGLTAETVQAALDELVVNLGSSDSAILALSVRLDTLEGTDEGSVAKSIDDALAPVKESVATETSRAVTKDSEHDSKLAQLTSKADALGAQLNDAVPLYDLASMAKVGVGNKVSDNTAYDVSSTRVDGAIDLTVKGQTVTNLYGGATTDLTLNKETNRALTSDIGYTFIVGHVYYIALDLLANTTTIGLNIQVTGGGGVYDQLATGIKTNLRTFYTPLNPNTSFYYYISTDDTAGTSLTFSRKITIVDLTTSGLSHLTADQCAQQFPYFDGTKSVLPMECKTVGKNLFDGELEFGTLSDTTGLPAFSTGVRSKNFSQIAGNTTYVLSNNLSYLNLAYWYDENKNYISRTTAPPYISPVNAMFFKLRTSTGGSERSLAAKFLLEEGTVATTYEPYKESIATSPVPLRSNATTQDTFDVKTGIHTQKVSAIDYTTLATPIITEYTPQDLTCGVHLLQTPYKSEVFITNTSGQLTTTYGIGSIKHVWAYDAEGEYELALTTDYTVAGNVLSIVGAGANVVISVDYYIEPSAPNSRIEYSTPIENTATRLNALEVLLTVLAGGTTGQVLSKVSDDDFDFAWVTP